MGGYPGISRWAQGNHKGPYKGKREEKGVFEASSVRVVQLAIAGFADAGRGL